MEFAVREGILEVDMNAIRTMDYLALNAKFESDIGFGPTQFEDGFPK
jgi:hypothetical protein